MLEWFVPNHKNEFRAHLLKTRALAVILIVIVLFNFALKNSLFAQSIETNISETTLLQLHNQERAKSGLGELLLNPTLSQSALNKAQVMLETNCWSHFCPAGKSPWEFFAEAGYTYVFAGENLAEGFYDVSKLMNAWMNSESHRENILKNEFTEVGFGIVYGNFQNNSANVLVAVHFGTQAKQVSLVLPSRKLEIISPKDGEVISSSIVNIEGIAEGTSKVIINLNNSEVGEASLLDGVFTYEASNLIEGSYKTYASGIDSQGNAFNSNEVNFVLNLPSQVEGSDDTVIIEGSGLFPIDVTDSVRNGVNFFFVIALAALFLVDFIVLSRTHILAAKRSYSHYHFVVLLLLGVIILTGGIAAKIGVGLTN